MREKDLEKLGYNIIKERLRSFAHSVPTCERIDALRPSADPEEVKERIALYRDFEEIAKNVVIPDFPDIRDLLRRVGVEGFVLSVEDLLSILKVLETIKDLRKVIGPHSERSDHIRKLTRALHNFSPVENLINSAIDRRGFVKDSASAELYRIRKKIRSLENEINLRLESLFNRPDSDTIFSDKIVTIRNGRYVVPVKTAHARSIFGIIHGTSSSGYTTYIEPQFIVHLNNQVSELKESEEEEVRRILRELTSYIKDYSEKIEESFSVLVEVDYLQCLYRLCAIYRGTFPEIGDYVDLRRAVHPLLPLQEKEAVPVNIRMKERKGLILTGPNTGGKTVALTLLGLTALMVQSGIPVPLEEGSTIPVFTGIYVDVGDEQSIDQNLSTFSAHMTNISEFLPHAGESDLVLLDELGAGTDPLEGSALGIGILEYLKQRSSWVFANTHHMPIKVYAVNSDYYVPASVMFDRETLRPLYTIAYNTVGESMAFGIAKKCGIPLEVISRAEKELGEMGRQYIHAIDRLSEFTQSYEEKLREVESLREKLSQQVKEYEEMINRLKDQEKKGWKEAYREARLYLQNLYAEGQKILKDLRRKDQIERFVEEKKGEILERISEQREVPKVGDTIYFEGGKGKVVKVDGGKVWVVSGGMRLEVSLDMIEKVERGAIRDRVEKKELPHPKGSLAGSEINLIGMDRESALIELERFIESAWAGGLKTVRIIHGIGSGTLKEAVQEFLSQSEKVKFFRSAYPREGGSGVTIAYLNHEE